jgi:hypothetical protein
MEEWRYSSTVLILGVRWRRVVSFTPLPLYRRGNNTLYVLVSPRAGEDVMENRKISLLDRIEPRLLGRPVRSLVDITAELSS